jgi:hypothetical protein
MPAKPHRPRASSHPEAVIHLQKLNKKPPVKTDRKAANRQDHDFDFSFSLFRISAFMKKLLTIAALAVAIATFTAPLARADFLSGTGAPASELGTNGDHYLDVQTSKLYKKASDSWSVLVARLAIKGDKGGKIHPRRYDYAIRAMAQTRGISRVCRSAFAHVVVLIDAELSTTPAEEAEQASDPETTAAPRESSLPKKPVRYDDAELANLEAGERRHAS